jgi:hypothetical protein
MDIENEDLKNQYKKNGIFKKGSLLFQIKFKLITLVDQCQKKIRIKKFESKLNEMTCRIARKMIQK